MFTTTVPQNRFLGKPLTQEDSESHLFICEIGNLVAALDEGLNESIAQFAGDFEIDEGDYVRHNSARQQLLRQFVSFLLQRPVADRELVREHLLDFEPVDSFFYTLNSNNSNFSSEGEKVLEPTPAPATVTPEMDALRRENNRLKLEVQTLRREKARAEEKAISALRYRPSSRTQRSFSSLDEYIENMMTDAVAESVRQVLAEDKANV